MNDRGPATKANIWAKAEEPAKDNALWRLSEWIPNASGMESLKVYHSELLKFNKRLNLIAHTTERDADEVHFADCLLACQLISAAKPKGPIIDVGSGNGLPGIILGVLNPSEEIQLVESDTRKCEFLKHAIGVLQLKNVKVMNTRLESLKNANVGSGITRGFASLSKTLLACNKVFAKGGKFYHLKGAAWAREIAEIPSQILSAWSPELLGEYSLPVSQARRGVITTTKL